MTSMKKRKNESGVSLMETMIAVVILMVLAAGMASSFGFCTGLNKNQGEVATRTIEMAQDKMEQLMALQYSDGTSNTTVFPTTAAGGTGLGGMMAGSTTVGGTTKGAPVTNYADYTDKNGNLLASSAGAFYTRQWSVTTNPGANLKTITVITYALNLDGGIGVSPSTTLVCMKSYNQ